MSAAWVLLAAAVLMLPARSRPRARSRSRGEAIPGLRDPGPAAPDGPGPGRPRLQLAVAAAAVVGACIAVAGVRTGAVLSAGAGPGAVFALRALQRRPTTVAVDRSVALTLDLAAAALRAGRPVADALTAAAPAADPVTGRALARVAGLLRLGADPAQAWSVLARDGPLGPVAVVATRSATSGVRLASSFERLAVEIRVEAAAAAAARAHRAGVRAMAPLGACFLPSFVCLGVVPVVVGIAGTAFGVLPGNP